MNRPTTTSPTVFVVDDDLEMRSSLSVLIDALGFRVQTFASAMEFRRAYQADRAGCLVLDVQMPRQTGLELYEQLLRDGRRLPVIFITGHANVATAVAAMKSGAIEFLEKPFDRRTLLMHIENALELDAEWRRRDREFHSYGQRLATLTAREAETLELVLAGDSNKVMAAKLFISERAVEMRRAALMRKLGVRSLVELLHVVVTHRLQAELRQAARNRPFLSP
jgi:FixJ family two-component response regulator